ncbi:MAG: LuxR C-terminal-related transcriptional regulator [Pseudonocardiaceae bacterium]
MEPQSPHQVSVGVVDTVPLFRDGISALVDRTPWIRLVAYSASQHGAMHLAEQTRPNMLIIDSGLDPRCHLTSLLANSYPALRVVVLIREAHRTPRYVANSLAAGAYAAVPRSAEPDRVVEALRHARQAQRYLDPDLANLVTKAKGQGSTPVTGPAPTQLALSRREYQVLQLIAEGLENAGIATSLFLSVETVRTHVKSILRKLSARDRTHAVAIAFRTGLLTLAPEDDLFPPDEISERAPVKHVV